MAFQKIGYRLSGQVHDAKGMTEPAVFSAMVNVMGQSQLVDPAQSLKFTSVYDNPFVRIHFNEPMYWVSEFRCRDEVRIQHSI